MESKIACKDEADQESRAVEDPAYVAYVDWFIIGRCTRLACLPAKYEVAHYAQT